jgi:DNA-binding NarL/FixJ family response regulator
VDDEPLLARGLRRVLIRYALVIEHDDAEQAERALERDGPFAGLVFQRSMPGKDGLRVLEFARARGIDTPAAIYTADEGCGYANRADALDARFIVKPGLDRIRAFAARVTSRFSMRAELEDAARRCAIRCRLTDMETLVLLSILHGEPRERLLDRCDITTSTLKSHRSRICAKTRMDIDTLRDKIMWELRGADDAATVSHNPPPSWIDKRSNRR